jgi:hypothetical protein
MKRKLVGAKFFLLVLQEIGKKTMFLGWGKGQQKMGRK